MYPICILHVSYMHPYMYPICILYASCVYPICILYASYMYPICILYVSYMYPISIRASTLRVDPGHSLHPTSWPWPEPPPYELTLATASNLLFDPGHCPREISKKAGCARPEGEPNTFCLGGESAAIKAQSTAQREIRFRSGLSVRTLFPRWWWISLKPTRTLHRTAVREKYNF